MLKTYCDKCGKELNYEEIISPIKIKYNYLSASKIRRIDLCSKCADKFEEYIDKYFEEGSNERS